MGWNLVEVVGIFSLVVVVVVVDVVVVVNVVGDDGCGVVLTSGSITSFVVSSISVVSGAISVVKSSAVVGSEVVVMNAS